MNEEAPDREAVEALDARAREALVRGVGLAALVAAGCPCPEVVGKAFLRELKAVHLGFGDFAVAVVGKDGELRRGALGLMTAEELAAEYRRDPGFGALWARGRTGHSNGKV